MLLITGDIFAQPITTPRAPSPAAEVSQTIGISEISVNYSRPAVKDREVWGKLVHYGYIDQGFGPAKQAPWRAGANENTVITFSHDAMVEGETIPAGSYGFFIGVHEDGSADIILSKNQSSWGSYFYSQEEDQLRVKVNTQEIPHTERLTFDFVDIGNTSATWYWIGRRSGSHLKLNLMCMKLSWPMQEMNSDQQLDLAGKDLHQPQIIVFRTISIMKKVLAGSIRQLPNTENFNTRWVKAQLVEQMGKESGSEYDEAAQMANNVQLNFMGYTMMGKGNNEKALEYFKLNAERNPNDPNTFDSLGECYKTMGEKKLAIKALKKSLSMDPPANVKTNSIKLLKEIGVDTSEYETAS